MEEENIFKINYTGREKSSGEIFDTTREKDAIAGGIFEKEHDYKPVTVAAGEGDLLPALDGVLAKMKKGEKKTVTLGAGEAFGERKAELVKMVPLQEFKNRNMQPFPGLIVELNNARGRVQSVSGGRVRVDFNHPLAGKEVEFELSVEEEIKGKKEKAGALFEKYFPFPKDKKAKLEVKESEIEVEIPSEFALAAAQFKKPFADSVLKHVKGIKRVKFSEEFTAEKKTGEKAAKEGKKKESQAKAGGQ